MKHADLIRQLTLEEKCGLLSGRDVWTTRPVPRLEVPSAFLSDGPTGLRKQMGEGDHLGLNASEPATCWPTAAAVANSWDPALGEAVGAALGEEALAQKVNMVLGPGLNIQRSPLCGRNFEYFSEDPYLAGKMAAGYIRGIQSKGVSACPKHFAANSQELRRMANDSVVDERTLREIYLTNFEIAVREGRPGAIMSSYNQINEVYTNEDPHLLRDILRDEWGFDGVVVTDWGGSNDHVEGVRAGSTLEMPGTAGDSDRQLAALCVGYGPGVPFSAFRDVPEPNTIFEENGSPVTVNDHPEGVNGYVSPAIPQEGIHSVYYKDGPAGIGETAWPGEMLLACSFDRKLLSSFGRAVAEECRAQGVDVWLAPALNLHRHPLGGRSFEYYSEDPFLAGACACAVLKGVQGRLPVLACAKHLAANEQETYRRGSAKTENGACLFDAVDSILPERVLRELYLKPFERAVKEGGLHCIMTSFNKINGVFAGGSKDLCTHILREEWGFDGAVVTDWGDMDIVVDGADAVAAGNDVVMPGGPPVIAQIFRGLEEGRLTRREMELAVGHLLSMVGRLKKGDCPHKLREEQGKG